MFFAVSLTPRAPVYPSRVSANAREDRVHRRGGPVQTVRGQAVPGRRGPTGRRQGVRGRRVLLFADKYVRAAARGSRLAAAAAAAVAHRRRSRR